MDFTFFGPLKTAYNGEVDKWMLMHPRQRVTDYDLCEVFSGAYQKVATTDKATKGFKSSGIFPFNQDICDEDYAPASVTGQPLEAEKGQSTTVDAPTPAQPLHKKTTKQHKQAKTAAAQSAGCPTPQRPTRVSVLEVRPLPHVTSIGVRKRKAESSSVITSSPYKAMLENKQTAVKCRGRPADNRSSTEVPEKSRKETEKQKTKVMTQVRTQHRQSTDGAKSSHRKKKLKPTTTTHQKKRSSDGAKTSDHSRCRSKKSKNRHISASFWPISIKFGMAMQFAPLVPFDR